MQAGNGSNGGIGRKGSRCITAAVVLFAASPAIAATPAGTPIANTATMTRTTDGGVEALASNTVTLTTAEILDVTIVADRATATVRNGDTVAIGFVLTNTGNGQEDYLVTIGSGTAGLSLDRLAIDSDGDGVYSAATDQTLAPGAAVPLALGQTIRVFALLDGAQVTAATAITAVATARTGSGAAGTAYPNGGDGGGDAVVGSTGATATATTQLALTTGVPTLAKTQSVLAPDGSARAIPGAIVTYRLVASFPGATRGVVIDDPVPTGTAYVPGSLRLDDAVLSDASNDDAGSATTTAIRVALGDVATAGSRSIQFSVKIQ